MNTAFATIKTLYPGLALAAMIALAAQFLGEHYGAPVMLFALLLGMAFNFLSEEGRCVPGIGFGSKTLLRIGVALLGARVTFGDLAALGAAATVSVLGLMALTIGAGFALARVFKRDWRFGLLTGGSVAICGASAALALSAVLPRGEDGERNTLFTVVAVTTLSTVAMIAYPILFATLGLSDHQIGFLIGATIHDVAQVVGAGYSVSEEVGDTATLVKLLRVAMMPLVILAVATMTPGDQGSGGAKLPWFVIAFALLMAINSLGLIPAAILQVLSTASRLCLVTAIAALGVKTSLKAMAAVGGGHIALVVAETLVLLAAAVGVALTLM